MLLPCPVLWPTRPDIGLSLAGCSMALLKKLKKIMQPAKPVLEEGPVCAAMHSRAKRTSEVGDIIKA
jgi:hypothetical protein